MNTFPQTPTSAFGYIDRASQKELEAMIASKNPYSAVALSKLQAIRDAKMKEQAQAKIAPPLSQTIPQEIQSMEEQSGIQKLPQGMSQGMPQGAAQGIASIGGAPTGAGGGMVSFNNGGNVRHFATGDPVKESTFGNFFRGLVPKETIAGFNYDVSDERKKEGERAVELNKERNRAVIPPYKAVTQEERRDSDNKIADIDRELLSIKRNRQLITSPSSNLGDVNKPTLRPAGDVTPALYSGFDSPTAGSPAAAASPADAGLGSLTRQAARLALDTNAAFKQPYEDQTTALQNTIDVMTEGQKQKDAARSPEKFAETQGTPEERDKLQSDRLAQLEKTMPDPYAKTAKSLASLGDELGKEKANAPYQAMLTTAFKLMSNKTPSFMAALGESGAAGLADYNQIKSANKKQEMALMSAETSLSAAQDARKRGMNSEANSFMKEFYDRKRDAFNFGVAAADASAAGALQLVGEKQKKPQLVIDQIKNTFLIQKNLLDHNLKIAELGLESQKLGMMAIPEVAKVAIYLQKYPSMAPILDVEANKNLFAKMYALGKKDQDKTSKTDDELIADAIKSVNASNKAFPMPMTYGK